MKYLGVVFLSCLRLSDTKIGHRRFGPPLADSPNARAVAPEWGTITQRVDHFNPTDLRTWSMRYINNSQFFEEGGPIFIYLGGEWTISNSSLMTGQIFDMAEEHRGYMFYTEHRYYGKSFPTPDSSLANLQFLSVDQALADLAYFIEYQKKQIAGLENSKVVVVGCSYSASMATWARLKYPHLINISYASSGPVRAVADFYEYLEVVNDSIGLVSEQCLRTIKDAIAQLEEKLETEEGISFISETFRTCKRLRTDEPYRWFFFDNIVQIFSRLVQYANQTSIRDDCNVLESFGGTALNKLTGYVRKHFQDRCLVDYDDFIAELSSNNLTSGNYRQWTYQTCTEYGYYQTTTSEKQPFGNTSPLQVSVDICTDLFGVNRTVLDIAINRTNLFYGSLKPVITRVVSVHGTVDPWHALGIVEDLNPLAPAFLINGTSHCADLSSVSPLDTPALRETKIKVKELITGWLQH